MSITGTLSSEGDRLPCIRTATLRGLSGHRPAPVGVPVDGLPPVEDSTICVGADGIAYGCIDAVLVRELPPGELVQEDGGPDDSCSRRHGIEDLHYVAIHEVGIALQVHDDRGVPAGGSAHNLNQLLRAPHDTRMNDDPASCKAPAGVMESIIAHGENSLRFPRRDRGRTGGSLLPWRLTRRHGEWIRWHHHALSSVCILGGNPWHGESSDEDGDEEQGDDGPIWPRPRPHGRRPWWCP